VWIHVTWQRGMATVAPFRYRVFNQCLVLTPGYAEGVSAKAVSRFAPHRPVVIFRSILRQF